MARAIIRKGSLPDVGAEEIEIFPYGEATMPRIGVLKFAKGMSRLELDPGQPQYRSMNSEKR